MSNFDLVEPLIGETWVVDGRVVAEPPGDMDALYIRPMLHQIGAVPSGTTVLHSLILDNNVFADMIGNRRSSNTDYLENLLRSRPLELNPAMALLEQRHKFGGASQALHDYAELLGTRFGSWSAKYNADTFDQFLEDGKLAIAQNMELLAGYLPAIVYLYHLSRSAETKLEWLGGLIRELDLPFLQLPFYLAALLFLVKDSPELFRSKLVGKVRKDTRLRSSIEEQGKAARNLAYDVMLPAMAILPGDLKNTLVFPYIATRDYLMQDFLGEVRCAAVVALPDGRANGAWELNPEGRLHAHLAAAISRCQPRRESPGSEAQKAMRRANLRAFSDSYLEKCAALKNTTSNPRTVST